MIHLTLGQSFATLSAGLAAWLMVRAGTGKQQLVARTRPRCASCGRKRTNRPCACTAHDR